MIMAVGITTPRLIPNSMCFTLALDMLGCNGVDKSLKYNIRTLHGHA
jgi:hypothetical protein